SIEISSTLSPPYSALLTSSNSKVTLSTPPFASLFPLSSLKHSLSSASCNDAFVKRAVTKSDAVGCHGAMLSSGSYVLPPSGGSEGAVNFDAVFQQITHLELPKEAGASPHETKPPTIPFPAAVKSLILALSKAVNVSAFYVTSLWLEASLPATQQLLPSL
ncbi:hypothetical protein TeGR_g13333, partial [Tetraparma gracilis]